MHKLVTKKVISRGQTIPVKFTFSQRDIILGKHQGSIPIDPLIDDTFGAGLVKGRSVEIRMTLDEIEELSGFVARRQIIQTILC